MSSGTNSTVHGYIRISCLPPAVTIDFIMEIDEERPWQQSSTTRLRLRAALLQPRRSLNSSTSKHVMTDQHGISPFASPSTVSVRSLQGVLICHHVGQPSAKNSLEGITMLCRWTSSCTRSSLDRLCKLGVGVLWKTSNLFDSFLIICLYLQGCWACTSVEDHCLKPAKTVALFHFVHLIY